VPGSIVISQSMYFPWVGLLEQIRLADVFVHYDDVQFSKGSFSNRVQVKTRKGSSWMTIPLRGVRLGQRLAEVQLDDTRDWRGQHQEMLHQAYRDAPFCDDMLALVRRVHDAPAQGLADVAKASMLELASYFDLKKDVSFVDVDSLGVNGASSQRVHDVVTALNGSRYVTGHGARNYLDHDLFERSSISVEYMNYRCIPYQQLHGAFTPYVSALDLVANCGVEGRAVICSDSVYWRKFINGNEDE
jgi:hypothetical protein